MSDIFSYDIMLLNVIMLSNLYLRNRVVVEYAGLSEKVVFKMYVYYYYYYLEAALFFTNTGAFFFYLL